MESIETSDKKANAKGAWPHLTRRMFDNGVPWIDCQVYTEHLARFGAKKIPRAEYLEMLNSALVPIASHKTEADRIDVRIRNYQ